MAHLMECSPPYDFDFLPKFPPDGLRLLCELSRRSFHLAFELGPHWAPPVQFGRRPIIEAINGVFWTGGFNPMAIADGGAPTRRDPISGPGTCPRTGCSGLTTPEADRPAVRVNWSESSLR